MAPIRLPPALDLAAWKAAGPEDHLAQLAKLKLREKAGFSPNQWINDGRLSPVQFYCYLKARFGRPTGSAMLFRSPSTDNFIQWNFAVVSHGFFIDIMGTRSQTEIRPFLRSDISTEEWDAFVDTLLSDMKHRREEIAAVHRTLEKWVLFVNPYRRLRDIAALLEEKATGIDLKEPVPPPTIAPRAAVEAYLESRQAYVKALVEAQATGLSLRMVVPVLMESFVNLLIFALAKKEIRADERLYENLLRTPVDVRAKSLSLNCEGFAGPIDGASPQFRAFHTIMNARNDLLHGNIDPTKLMFDEAFFDERVIPLFKDEVSLFHRLIRSSTRHVELSAGLADLASAHAFIEYLLGKLEPGLRKFIEALMANSYPGWRKDEKRAGILFDDTLWDVFPVSDPPPAPAGFDAQGN